MSNFKEWFTSNVTEYTYLCEQFYLDCELIDADLRKQRLRNWIEYAYKAGQQTKEEQ